MMDDRILYYTLTGAADWPMLSIIGGGALVFFNLIVLALIGVVWKSMPSYEDLQRQRDLINIDIKGLAKEFASILDKHLDRQREDCLVQRTECRNRYDRQFNGLFAQKREFTREVHSDKSAKG